MSANRFKGEIAVEVGGRRYTLVMDFNVMAEFEEATGIGALDFLGQAEQGNARISLLRAFTHAALLPHQPDATVEDAGDLLSEDQTVIGRLIAASVPEVEAGNGKAAARKRPPARR